MLDDPALLLLPVSCETSLTFSFLSPPLLATHHHRACASPAAWQSWSIDHTIALVGWGEGYSEMAGKVVPYWILRNSWGTAWGEGGWMRIVRGVNALGLESQCAYAVPTKVW